MTMTTIRAEGAWVPNEVVPAMTLGEYHRRTANATRPITDPPIGARRRPGSSPTWGDFT